MVRRRAQPFSFQGRCYFRRPSNARINTNLGLLSYREIVCVASSSVRKRSCRLQCLVTSLRSLPLPLCKHFCTCSLLYSALKSEQMARFKSWWLSCNRIFLMTVSCPVNDNVPLQALFLAVCSETSHRGVMHITSIR